MASVLPPSGQLLDFLAVVDNGGFSGAARALGKAQPAVTYSVRELEASLGVTLLDRSKRPLEATETGLVLAARARRIVQDLKRLQSTAKALSEGLEAELPLVVDSLFPMGRLLPVVREFASMFPTVALRVAVEPLYSTINHLFDGTSVLAITGPMVTRTPGLVSIPVLTVDRIPVAASFHPLASIAGTIPSDQLREHIHILLRDRTEGSHPQAGPMAPNNWGTSDLGAKRAMILAGLGWGSLPLHLAQPDLDSGALRHLSLAPNDGRRWLAPLQLYVAHKEDVSLGPAASWLLERLGGGEEKAA